VIGQAQLLDRPSHDIDRMISIRNLGKPDLHLNASCQK